MASIEKNGEGGERNPALAAALAYAERGWPVFPCAGKRPRTRHGLTDATNDPAQIRQWWDIWPDADIAIRTGGGLAVLDVDPRHGGDEALAELEHEHGKLPETVRAVTGGGGEHYFLTAPESVRNSADKLGPGLDVRGSGGFVVAPPSVHASGQAYEWDVPPGEADLATVPNWLLDLITAKPNNNGGAAKVGPGVAEGKRNATLTSLAGSMRRRGAAAVAIAAALKAENEAYAPPLGAEEVERIAASVAKYEPEPEEEPKKSQATRLVELAAEDELFHADQTAYARFGVDAHHEVSTIRTRGYRSRLARRFFEAEQRAPSSQALQDALGVLEGQALYGGEEHPVATRLAEHEGAVYLDLANSRWEGVKVDTEGWRVVTDPPVRFRRPKGMAELPRPVAGDLEPLRDLVNLESADWPLFVAWLLAALRPIGPYPVLTLHGEQGSAKSSTARIARALVDPNTASLRAAPKSGHDLMIAATNGWVVALDNLSTVQPWLSDGLCRLATGGGFATRTLYENDEETIFEAQRPVLLNGIGELAERSDLIDRAIVLESPRIADADRLTEKELWRRFEAARPAILGALLDGVARGLRDLDGVKLTNPPRMADFAEWAVAALPGVGIDSEDFLAAYADNRSRGSGAALETSPITGPLLELAADGIEATASELLTLLGDHASETDKRSEGWPRSAAVLGKLLTRLAPNLRDADLQVEHATGGNRRTWQIRTRAQTAVPAVLPSESGLQSQEPADGKGSTDGTDGSTDGTRTAASQVPAQAQSRMDSGIAASTDGRDGTDGSLRTHSDPDHDPFPGMRRAPGYEDRP